MTLPDNTASEIKWSAIENFEDFDTRRSAVDCMYANIKGVNEAIVEWCPNVPEDKDEYYAWVWSVKPSLGEEIKKICSKDLSELIDAYNSNQMDNWFEN